MRRLVVVVKQVPATENVRMDPDTGTLIRSGVETIVNPLDLHAVEAALRIQEEEPNARVAVVSMGPPSAIRALREAVAMGCDDAYLLSGREFAGSDTWATAYALERAIAAIGGADLVLCGLKATDGETGQVGPMLAAMMGVPALTYVNRLKPEGDSKLLVRRAIENGEEILECSLPAVVCVVRDINEPRWPTLAGKTKARRKTIPTLGAKDIAADMSRLGLLGSPTRVVGMTTPTITRTGTKLSQDELSIAACVRGMIQYLQDVGVRSEV